MMKFAALMGKGAVNLRLNRNLVDFLRMARIFNRMTHTAASLSLSRRSLLGGIAGALTMSAAPRAFAAGTLDVVATTGMIADAARVVGGDLVSVKGLMGAGVDPHAYRQTRSDIVAMTRADLVLWHGLYLEAQMESFFGDLARKQPVVAVAEGLPAEQLLAHEDYEGRFDPHVWMDPTLWARVVDSVRAAMTEVQPDQAETFAANAQAYAQELDALDTYAREAMGKLTPEQRVLVTAHDAFSYFGHQLFSSFPFSTASFFSSALFA